MAAKENPTHVRSVTRWGSGNTACGKNAAEDRLVDDPRLSTCGARACALERERCESTLNSASRRVLHQMVQRRNPETLCRETVTDENTFLVLRDDGTAVLVYEGQDVLAFATPQALNDLASLLNTGYSVMTDREVAWRSFPLAAEDARIPRPTWTEED